MRKISTHVQQIIESTPFLSEVLSEGIGNTAAIARLIQKNVEARTLTKVSLQSIVMALHRVSFKERRPLFGFRFIKHITDIKMRSGLTLFFISRAQAGKKVYDYLAKLENEHPGTMHVITKGRDELLVVAREECITDFKKKFGNAVRIRERVSAITIVLPKESLPVPGTFYPIFKSLAWEGIAILEIASVEQELVIYLDEAQCEHALHTIRTLTRNN